MKKLLVAILFLAIAAGLFSPFLLGVAAESRMEERAEKLSESPFTQVHVAEFERGWFTSHAKLAFSLSDEYRDQLEAQILATLSDDAPISGEVAAFDEQLVDFLDGTVLVDVELTHGPIIVDDGLSVGLAGAVLRLDAEDGAIRELQDELGMDDILEIGARTGLDGVTHFEGGIPAMHLTDEEDQVSFSGLNLDGSIDWLNDKYSLQGRSASTQLTGPEGELSISNFYITAEQQRLADYVWLGDFKLGIEKFSGSSQDSEGGETLEIADIEMSTSVKSGSGPESVDFNITYSIGAVSVPGELDLNDAVVNVTFTDLDVNALATAYELNERFAVATEGDWVGLLPEFQDVAYDILTASPSIAVDPIAFAWNGERFKARMDLSADAGALPPRAQFSFMSVGMWNQLLSADLDLDVSRKLAQLIAIDVLRRQLTAGAEQGLDISPAEIDRMSTQQAPVLLETFVQQGFINRGPSGYLSSLSYGGGALTVNGKPMPLPMLQ
jgi:uncharacterized protein YdgA (DUF945 family)